MGSPGTVAWSETNSFTMRAHQDTTLALQPGYVADKLVGPGTYSDAWSVAYTTGAAYPSIAALVAFR